MVKFSVFSGFLSNLWSQSEQTETTEISNFDYAPEVFIGSWLFFHVVKYIKMTSSGWCNFTYWCFRQIDVQFSSFQYLFPLIPKCLLLFEQALFLMYYDFLVWNQIMQCKGLNPTGFVSVVNLFSHKKSRLTSKCRPIFEEMRYLWKIFQT